MQDFGQYLKNINLWFILDVVFIVVVAFAILMFFKRRNNMVMAVFVSFYVLVYLAVCIVIVTVDNNILFISRLILEMLGLFLLVSVPVAYQSDIKAFFARVGKIGEKNKFNLGINEDDLRIASGEIVKACQTLSKNDIGALIIIAPTSVPKRIMETGTALNADVSCSLLESIFNTKAPLHDGAVIIKGNMLLSAGCFLPLSQEVSLSKELGTRHRAAIGITEETDVLAIVVSEETGIISTARGGKLRRYMTPEKLYDEIEEVFGIAYTKTSKKSKNKGV